MSTAELARARLGAIPGLALAVDAPLSRYTRFGIGGNADLYAETESADAFVAALAAACEAELDVVVIGDGTNLIVSDDGFRGLVLRYRAGGIRSEGDSVSVDAGASLQALVDFTVERGLEGMETLAGIPGSVGAAVYGNAGAYGHSISERIRSVRFFDGSQVREFDNRECRFQYRESVFKIHKEWTIFSAELRLEPADSATLRRTAADIVETRNRKFPSTLKCAGSIFKNLLLRDLPAGVASRVPPATVREGKVPAAWFLEQVGAKGAQRGGIRVADYHANLIYNSGGGTAADLRALIGELQARVRQRFGLDLEEEVQYVGRFE
ncbi:MAG TPA: UDP-N-acetylmuramate dehydrogenase [Bryobacteraceae bacterium]|nr:UDP-N-acetylmuramate dehydrogenase [Bryobacteraceae bacterium]